MRVGYFVNQYPKVSHSFIRREILAVERQGIEIERYALRGWAGDLVDPADRRERERTHYILRRGITGLLGPSLRYALRSPMSFFKALAIGWRQWRSGDRSLALNLVTLAEACQLALWLERDRIRHLHVHFGTNSAVVAMMVKALSGIGFSLTIHGSEEWDSPRQLRIGEKVAQSRFVAAISHFTRAQLVRWSGLAHADRVHVVHCGLERKDAVDPGPVSGDNRRFVCVGRLCRDKAQTMLIEALAQVDADTGPVELVLAGDGDARAEVERRVARAGLGARVRITGWIDEAQVQRELANARALILPSFSEGLPVVIMEAMAAGRPVLSTYVGGIAELVENGKEGWLFPAGSVDLMAQAMRECLATPIDRLNEMGARGRAKVWANHSVDIEAARLAGLFRSVEP
ncbi:MAG: glycosyltransferase family 4 protein [Burkholderiaceae bacterium]|nr:glycosyltransferase family 4 protein [Burkholderiaceae bacterium]